MTTRTRVINEGLEECIEDCRRCHRLCLETVVYLAGKGVVEANTTTNRKKVELLLLCAEICQSNVNLLLIGGDASLYGCMPCAEICKQCTMILEPSIEDRQLQLCFDACCQSVASCRRMAGMPSVRDCSAPESELERELRRERQRDKVEQASWESFPASDPPAF